MHFYNTLSCTITNLYLDWNGPSVPIDHCSYQERSGHDAEAMFYAPNNVNPVGGLGGEGGVRARNGIWQILKFFDQIPKGRKRKVNQKCQKSPTPGEKI